MAVGAGGDAGVRGGPGRVRHRAGHDPRGVRGSCDNGVRPHGEVPPAVERLMSPRRRGPWEIRRTRPYAYSAAVVAGPPSASRRSGILRETMRRQPTARS
ncbi:hypothetical protein SAV14893_062920 [Streptomyces avermitilis]|uniref:Uncharacterized protein n=1 Tax=Streptomyces avermitilis TaxID=33903 RepID=A0A4D4M5I3_STRAX|nr:hypothetical protein SAVMC3_75380 [Streptomyces avermitilis]GDY66899.1 hypothetical protein SAV14893_062920 [Streptomyces avermitilis]